MSIVASSENGVVGCFLSSLKTEGMGLSKMGKATATKSFSCGLLFTTKARVEAVFVGSKKSHFDLGECILYITDA